MQSITQNCLLEDSSHKLLHFSPDMAEQFRDWYVGHINVFEEPQTVTDVIDEFIRLRTEEVKEKLVNSSQGFIDQMLREHGSVDIEELAVETVDIEMANDYSVYNGIVEDVYIHMKMAMLCSDSETGFVFDSAVMSAYPFAGNFQTIGAQVTLYYISPSTGRAYPTEK